MHWRSQSGLTLRTVPMNPLSEPVVVIIDPCRARCELTHSSVPQLMVSARSSRNNPRFVRSDASLLSKPQQRNRVRLSLFGFCASEGAVCACVCVCVCVCVFAWGWVVSPEASCTDSLSFFLVWERHQKKQRFCKHVSSKRHETAEAWCSNAQMHTFSLSHARARALCETDAELGSAPHCPGDSCTGGSAHAGERIRIGKKSISDDNPLTGQMASLFKTIRAAI